MASDDFSSESSDASTTPILSRNITTNSSEESSTSSDDSQSIHTPERSNSTVLDGTSSTSVHPSTPVRQDLPEIQREVVEPSEVQVGAGNVGVGSSAQNDAGPEENNVILNGDNEVAANNKKKRQVNIDYFYSYIFILLHIIKYNINNI